MESKEWPLLAVSSHRCNMLTIYLLWIHWSFVLIGHKQCNMQMGQQEWQTYIMHFLSPVLLQIPSCIDYCNFIEGSKSGIVSPMILFFKIVLTTTDPVHFLTNFRISLSIFTLKKISWDLIWNYTEYTHGFGENCHFDNIESSDMWPWHTLSLF